MIEASEAIGQVKLELLAHQNGHVAELDSTGDDGADFGGRGKKRGKERLAERTQPSKGESDVTAVRVKTKKRL